MHPKFRNHYPARCWGSVHWEGWAAETVEWGFISQFARKRIHLRFLHVSPPPPPPQCSLASGTCCSRPLQGNKGQPSLQLPSEATTALLLAALMDGDVCLREGAGMRHTDSSRPAPRASAAAPQRAHAACSGVVIFSSRRWPPRRLCRVQSRHPAAGTPALGKSGPARGLSQQRFDSASSSCGHWLMRSCREQVGRIRALSPGSPGSTISLTPLSFVV